MQRPIGVWVIGVGMIVVMVLVVFIITWLAPHTIIVTLYTKPGEPVINYSPELRIIDYLLWWTLAIYNVIVAISLLRLRRRAYHLTLAGVIFSVALTGFYALIPFRGLTMMASLSAATTVIVLFAGIAMLRYIRQLKEQNILQ